VLDRPECNALALKVLDRIWNESWSSERGMTHAVGRPEPYGLLDDQVQAAAAFLDAYEAEGEPRWLERAMVVMRRARAEHWDDEAGGFFDVARERAGAAYLTTRAKPVQDSPTPSANGVAAVVLARVWAITEQRNGATCWTASWRRSPGVCRSYPSTARHCSRQWIGRCIPSPALPSPGRRAAVRRARCTCARCRRTARAASCTAPSHRNPPRRCPSARPARCRSPSPGGSPSCCGEAPHPRSHRPRGLGARLRRLGHRRQCGGQLLRLDRRRRVATRRAARVRSGLQLLRHGRRVRARPL